MTERPEPIIYAYSVKLETTAKGLITPTVSVHANDPEQAKTQAVKLYLDLVTALKEGKLTPASETTG